MITPTTAQTDGYEADPSLGEVIIQKHRNGPTGEAKVRFIEQYGKFVNYNEGENGGFMEYENEPSVITKQSRMNVDENYDTPPNQVDLTDLGNKLWNERSNNIPPEDNFDSHISEDSDGFE